MSRSEEISASVRTSIADDFVVFSDSDIDEAEDIDAASVYFLLRSPALSASTGSNIGVGGVLFDELELPSHSCSVCAA